MGDLRGTVEYGHAKPFNLLKLFGLLRPTGEPQPSKFEGKWFGGEDPEGADEVALQLYEKRSELQADEEQKLGFKRDNISQMKHRVMSSDMAQPRPMSGPMFSDYRVGSYVYGYNMKPQADHRHEQWHHCVGQLGEDHPTCQKANWYYRSDAYMSLAGLHEELYELGHYDAVRKWGVKCRRSFLPRYQPVKENIPGAYEYFRSKNYLENWELDGSGNHWYPVSAVE